MKVGLNKFLQVSRKFGFIMAVVMVSPYAVSIPAVMGSDSYSENETHEISMDELEAQYEGINGVLEKERMIIETLEQYLVLEEDGTLTLLIPEGVVTGLPEEEYTKVLSQLEFVNNSISNGHMYILEENGNYHVIMTETDSDFIAQANSNSFSVRWYGNRIRIDYSTMRTIYLKLASYSGYITNWKAAFTASVTWQLIKYAYQHPGAQTIGWALLSILPNSLGAFIAYAIEAIAAVLASPYFLIAVVVVVLSGIYNYSKIRTAGTSWTDGTEIRTYGVYAYLPASTIGLIFPSYREQ